MPQWTDIGPIDDFTKSTRKAVTAEQRRLLVLHLDGSLHAFADHCPHAGLPLTDADLMGKIITCPFHGYAFNVETGCNADYPSDSGKLVIFPIRKTEAGRVEVDLQPAESA